MSNDPADELTVTTDPEEIRSWAESRQLVPAYVRADEAAELEAETGGGRHEFVHRDDVGEHHETRDWDTFLRTVEEEDLALTYEDAGEEAWGQYALVERAETRDVSRDDLRAAGPPPEDAPESAAGEADEGIPTETGVTGETGATDEAAGEPAPTESAAAPDEPVAGEGEGAPPADETPPTEEAGEPAPPEDTGTGAAEESPGDVNAAGESGATDELGEAGTPTDTDEASLGAERPDGAEGPPGADDPRGTGDATVSEHDEGKTVVDANDNEVGIVTDVRGGDVYVDPNPDVVEKVTAKLGWSSADEESYTVSQEDVVEVRRDEVELAPLEGLDR